MLGNISAVTVKAVSLVKCPESKYVNRFQVEIEDELRQRSFSIFSYLGMTSFGLLFSGGALHKKEMF